MHIVCIAIFIVIALNNSGSEAKFFFWLLAYVGSLLALLFIQIYLHVTRGQSIGKSLLGLRIVCITNGEIPSFYRVYFLRLMVPGMICGVPIVGQFFALIDAFYIFKEDRRCLHDLLAKTMVIKVIKKKEEGMHKIPPPPLTTGNQKNIGLQGTSILVLVVIGTFYLANVYFETRGKEITPNQTSIKPQYSQQEEMLYQKTKAAHPDIDEVLSDNRLLYWIETLPVSNYKEYMGIYSSGSTEEFIWLLDEYKKSLDK
ncbi:MAG: RDD family protein [Bacteroidetes bacterium]|nr:RDD family protein [Bacteroidota bacterium]